MLSTDLEIRKLDPKTALKPGEKQKDFYIADASGLLLRLTYKGKKTFQHLYPIKNSKKKKRLTLGVYPALSLADARAQTLKNRDVLTTGRDPRAAQGGTTTVTELCALRVKDMEGKGRRSAVATKKMHAKYIIPLVGHELLKDFQIDPHFNMCIDPLYDRGKRRMAGMVGTELKTLFCFAAGKGKVPYNPIQHAKHDTGLKAKERFLSAAEITTLWSELPDVVENIAYQRILMLILLTGCRLSEICKLRRDEIDLKEKTISLGKSRVKTGDKFGGFKVPLCDRAVTILRDAMRETNNPVWLFPRTKGKRAGEQPISHSVVDRDIARAHDHDDKNKAKKFKTAKFTPHDLRRTLVSQMMNEDNEDHFGILTEFDVGLLVNHKSTTKKGTTLKHYNWNEYLNKKLHLIAKWGSWIDTLIRTPDGQREAA